MQGAFNENQLRVDLTSGTTQVEEVPELIHRKYLGGSAMAAYFLVRELKPGIEPLGPDNVLVFTTCLTNGAPISGTTRFTAAAKSPLTSCAGVASLCPPVLCLAKSRSLNSTTYVARCPFPLDRPTRR